MADRILTNGLKTGTGVGGVKYILLRGLISSAVIPVIRRANQLAIEYETILEDVTPDDNNDLTATGILYIGSAGNVKVTGVNGGTVTLVGVPAGTWLNFIRVKKVFATGTTASSIVLAR